MKNSIYKRAREVSTMLGLILASTVGIAALSVGDASAQPVYRNHTHLRWGVEGGGGGDWGTPRGPSLGLFGQIGAQFNDRWALFYQPSLMVHALSTSEDADQFAAFGNLAMADATFGIFQLGGGAGFDIGHFADCDNGTCVAGSRLVQPAIAGRMALIAPIRSYRYGRLGIPFAFHAHTTFLDNGQRLTALLLTIGVERF
jgi:hypothetical protein